MPLLTSRGHLSAPVVIGPGRTFAPIRRLIARVQPRVAGSGTGASTNVSSPVQTNTISDPYFGWLTARRRR